MSSKINVKDILIGHVNTLKDSSGNLSRSDIFTFFISPFLISAFGVITSFTLNKDISSLLVNFGAILTALLLSVLVLVYDQEVKLDERTNEDSNFDIKKRILSELYFNISYSIICSIFLILLCLTDTAISDKNSYKNIESLIITPITIFIAINLILTMLMIVKRMHLMLTTRNT